MGRERTRAGKFVYFCAACLIPLFLLSCMTSNKEFNSRTSQEVSQGKIPSPSRTSQEVSQAKISSPEESITPACDRLLRSKKLFHLGDYAGSLKESQRILSLPGKHSLKDQALFHMGLIYAYVENPQRDFGKALGSFKKILKDYPKSPLADEAKVWAGMLQENLKLSQVIEKTKQVDISVEEKKREKAR